MFRRFFSILKNTDSKLNTILLKISRNTEMYFIICQNNVVNNFILEFRFAYDKFVVNIYFILIIFTLKMPQQNLHSIFINLYLYKIII